MFANGVLRNFPRESSVVFADQGNFEMIVAFNGRNERFLRSSGFSLPLPMPAYALSATVCPPVMCHVYQKQEKRFEAISFAKDLVEKELTSASLHPGLVRHQQW